MTTQTCAAMYGPERSLCGKPARWTVTMACCYERSHPICDDCWDVTTSGAGLCAKCGSRVRPVRATTEFEVEVSQP